MSDTDINVLFPSVVLVVKDEPINIRPFYFGELPVVIKLVYPILSAAGLSRILKITKKPDTKNEIDVTLVIPENFVDLLLAALNEASEPVVELLCFATGKERAWFNTLPIDDGIALTEAWFAMNKDFFVRRVLPKLTPMMQSSVGSTSSQSSSPADTPDETLIATQ